MIRPDDPTYGLIDMLSNALAESIDREMITSMIPENCNRISIGANDILYNDSSSQWNPASGNSVMNDILELQRKMCGPISISDNYLSTNTNRSTIEEFKREYLCSPLPTPIYRDPDSYNYLSEREFLTNSQHLYVRRILDENSISLPRFHLPIDGIGFGSTLTGNPVITETRPRLPRMHRIPKYKTKVYVDEYDRKRVKFWDTVVVEFDDNEIILNTGGWRTPTTKNRMNQVSNVYDLKYGVFQKKGQWYVEYRNEITSFQDNEIMILSRN